MRKVSKHLTKKMASKPPSKRQHLIRQTRSTNSSDTPSISASVAMLDDVEKKFKKARKNQRPEKTRKKVTKSKASRFQRLEDSDPEEEFETDSEMEPESEMEIEAMPDEILLKIFKQLHLFNLGKTAQVSKRWQRLSQDESLWSKINLMSCAVESEFIEKCLKNGCKYLNLNDCHIFDKVDVPSGTKLKYLRVSGNYLDAGITGWTKVRIDEDSYDPDHGIDEESYEVWRELNNHDSMVHQFMKSSNLNSLEKLSYKKVQLDLDPLVFNNCQTLTVLHISAVNLYLRDMELICNNLSELSQLSLIDCSLENETITFLCQNLTVKIKNLSINLNKEIDPTGISKFWRKNQATSVTPDHITALGQRCPNLEEFFLGGEEYTLSESTLDAIIDNLKYLFKLRLPEYLGEYSKLVRLSTMLNLKNLYISTVKAGFYSHHDMRRFMLRDNALIRSLIKDLPKQVVINNGRFGTASPFTSISSSCGLWEIVCEKLDHFMYKGKQWKAFIATDE